MPIYLLILATITIIILCFGSLFYPGEFLIAIPCQPPNTQLPGTQPPLSVNWVSQNWKLSQIDGTSATPVGVTHTVTVNDDQTWSLHVHGQEVQPSHCNAIKNYPSKLSPYLDADLLKKLDSMRVCVGNPNYPFIQLWKARKGNILSTDGTPSAYVDSITIELNGVRYSETVQTLKCQVMATMWSVKPVKSTEAICMPCIIVGKSAPKKKMTYLAISMNDIWTPQRRDQKWESYVQKHE